MDPENEALLGDAPEDETPEAVKPAEETPESEDKKGEKGNRRSEIAQKIKYREKYEKANARTEALEKELQELKGLVKKPTDDQEARAQEYIRTQARQVYEELLQAKEKESKEKEDAFADSVEAVLEANPDIAEEELLDAVEEFDVDPKTAARILKRSSDSKKEKPKLPKAKGSAPSEEKTAPPDDKEKSLWQIAKEEAAKFGR